MITIFLDWHGCADTFSLWPGGLPVLYLRACLFCAAALKQYAQRKGGSKGGICFVHSLSERGAPPAHTIGTHSQNQTELNRRKRGGKDEAGGESGAKMPALWHF